MSKSEKKVTSKDEDKKKSDEKAIGDAIIAFLGIMFAAMAFELNISKRKDIW